MSPEMFGSRNLFHWLTSQTRGKPKKFRLDLEERDYTSFEKFQLLL
jgi:hypothetical protein